MKTNTIISKTTVIFIAAITLISARSTAQESFSSAPRPTNKVRRLVPTQAECADAALIVLVRIYFPYADGDRVEELDPKIKVALQETMVKQFRAIDLSCCDLKVQIQRAKAITALEKFHRASVRRTGLGGGIPGIGVTDEEYGKIRKQSLAEMYGLVDLLSERIDEPSAELQRVVREMNRSNAARQQREKAAAHKKN